MFWTVFHNNEIKWIMHVYIEKHKSMIHVVNLSVLTSIDKGGEDRPFFVTNDSLSALGGTDTDFEVN